MEQTLIGARFRLAAPVRLTAIGGHFAGTLDQATIFGAVAALSGPEDFPDSTDLSTPDILARAVIATTNPSTEVLGTVDVILAPGWHALIFGSSLFGATGEAAAVLNGLDADAPSYFRWSPNSVDGWFPLDPLFRNYRLVALGEFVPEPRAIVLVAIALWPIAYIRPRRV